MQILLKAISIKDFYSRQTIDLKQLLQSSISHRFYEAKNVWQHNSSNIRTRLTTLNYITITYLLIIAICQLTRIFSASSIDREILHTTHNDRLPESLRATEQCIGKQFGLYVPYNAVKVFWSGFGVAHSAKVATEIAQHISEQEGKPSVTLEMLLQMEENAHIKTCQWTISVTPECRQFWQDLSCEYATATEGEVRVILGSKLNPESVWLKTEKAQLEHRRSAGQDLWGFKEYELKTIYCKEMAARNSQILEIKNEICTADFE